MFAYFRSIFISVLLLASVSLAFAANVPIETFDLSMYSQDPNYYVPTSSKDYNKPILTVKKQNDLLKDLIEHYVGDKSPWSKSFFNQYTQDNNLEQWVEDQTASINNNRLSQDQKVYKENFRLLSTDEYRDIVDNMNLSGINLRYQENNRAIVTRTAMSYTVAYSKPLFLKFTLPGEGYPFSIINQSSLNIGQAVYIISVSIDKKWYLVLADSFYGWVKADNIARISSTQLERWGSSFTKARLSVRSFDASILSSDNQEFIADAYPGTMLPLIGQSSNDSYSVLIPINLNNKLSLIEAAISKSSAVKVPILTTPANFISMIKDTEGFPYGWGNEYFYTDCSSELRAIYQAFGIWLPRNSGDQGKAYPSMNLDDKSPDERVKVLLEEGRPFVDFIELQGHVMMYVGKSQNPNDTDELVPATYQQVWGLRDEQNSKRSVIGQSVFLPLLDVYPQDSTLQGLQAKKIFRIVQIS